jgi:hypothetical protein
MGMAEHGMAARNGNGLCGEGRIRKTVRGGDNGNDRTRNGSREWEWALRGGGMGMAEHGMTVYPLPP